MHYNRQNPFYAKLKSRYLLGGEGDKQTYHISLDLADSGISYDVGDCAVILPQNDPEVVSRILKAIGVSGDEEITRKGIEHTLRLEEALLYHCDLADITRSLISLAGAPLEYLTSQEQRVAFKEFKARYEVWDFLEEYPIKIDSPQVVVDVFKPLMPRFYSIASHQQSVNGELHLIVAYLKYIQDGKERSGACTNYLCHLANGSVPLYIHPHKEFTLPDDPEAAIIMIGPGTGVAPYRGFMQKRLFRGDRGKSWLFFGEKKEERDFFYRDFWESLVRDDKLRLSTAFSRDQEHKIYVQHRLQEHAKELFLWIQQGAYLFVCGDASHMAKDVEATLLQIFMECGGLSSQEAALYLKELRSRGRYLRDVY